MGQFQELVAELNRANNAADEGAKKSLGLKPKPGGPEAPVHPIIQLHVRNIQHDNPNKHHR